jgi:hypothetical protein
MFFADTPNLQYWTSGAHVATHNWIWTGDSHGMSNTDWATNEPTADSSPEQACVNLYNGYLYDMPCSSTNHYFICEENCPKQSRDINVVDTKGLVNLGGRNYFFSLVSVSSGNIIITYVRTEQEKKNPAITVSFFILVHTERLH